MQNRDYEAAYEIAKLARNTVEGAHLDHPHSELGFVTNSIGVSTEFSWLSFK